MSYSENEKTFNGFKLEYRVVHQPNGCVKFVVRLCNLLFGQIIFVLRDMKFVVSIPLAKIFFADPFDRFATGRRVRPVTGQSSLKYGG